LIHGFANCTRNRATKVDEFKKLETFRKQALKVMFKADNQRGPFTQWGAYFLWVTVSFDGKRVHRLCIGCGYSGDGGQTAQEAVLKMNGVKSAWVNFD
jgi:hypothetical protein